MTHPMNCQQHYSGTQQPMKRHIYHKHLSDLVHTQAGNCLSASAVFVCGQSSFHVSRDYMFILYMYMYCIYQFKTCMSRKQFQFKIIFSRSLSLFHSEQNFCDRLTLKLLQDEHKKSTLSPSMVKNRAAGHWSNPDQLKSCN